MIDPKDIPSVRPGPTRCPTCGHGRLLHAAIEYTTKVADADCSKDEEGIANFVEVTIPDFICKKCEVCGEIAIGNSGFSQLVHARCHKLGLLSPSKIAYDANRIGISINYLAMMAGLAPAYLEKLITGHFNIRQIDNDRIVIALEMIEAALQDLEPVGEMMPMEEWMKTT